MAVTEAPAPAGRAVRAPLPDHHPGSAQDPAPPRGVRGDLGLTLGAGVATIAAILPIARLVLPSWLGGAILTVAVVLLAGYLLRRAGIPELVAALGELVAWTVCATVALGHEEALLGLLPTPEVIGDLPGLLERVGAEIVEGVAPMDPSREFSFLLVSAAGLLATCAGHILRTMRLPLLAALVLITVFVIPQLAVPGDPDLAAAVLLIAAILWLVRTEIRSRRPGMEAGPVASTWAAVLGVASVVAALILAPGVPLSAPSGGGVGRTSSISATLDLGDDLRRPAEVEVLRVRTDGPTPPYLRVATLTRFDGETWMPDASPSGDLSFEPVRTTANVADRTTSVEITRLTGAFLPVPYPATEVTGVVGEWTANALNRTVRSGSASALGQRYEVRSQEPQATREQARDAMPRLTGAREGFELNRPSDVEFSFDTLTVPDEPASDEIRATAEEVIGDADNAYDALVALQTWFRSGGGFTYSLDAPVEAGFDGSGMDAMERFLQVRSGYCVHFASTFAVMARSVGIPARVVVGFLPGTATGDQVDDQDVYSVLGSQLHAWPETYLNGIGWVPFEPTVGLGTPTSLRSEVAPGAAPTAGPDASQAPTPSPSSSRLLERSDAGGGTTTSTAFDPAALLRGLGLALAALVLLSLPAAIRAVRWMTRLAAARRGDAGAAWRELQDLVIDAGLSVDESDSPRVFAARLSAEHGVPPDALATLVRAIERASFAPPDGASGPDLARALARARSALLPAGRERLRATVLPRSIVVRPTVTAA
jgi:transglutaminase-like putative cysteine protease